MVNRYNRLLVTFHVLSDSMLGVSTVNAVYVLHDKDVVEIHS